MNPRALRHLLTIRSAWIAVIPFLLSALLGWIWLRPLIIADTEEHQRQLAAVIASRTEDHLAASARHIARTASVLSRRLVTPLATQEYLDIALMSSDNLTSLTVTDINGRISAIALPRDKASLRQEMTGIDLSLTSAVRQVRASGKPSWSDVYLSPVGGGLTVAYATPVHGGAVLGEISLSQLSGFLKDVAGYGRHSVYILDRYGQVIADQEGRYTARQYNLTNLEIVREGLASDKPVTRYFPFNGIKVVGCLIRAPLLNWNILVTSPVDLAFRSALTTTGIFAAALCTALFLASGLSLLMSHSLAGRFEKLVDHARMVESESGSGDWPKSSILEFNHLAEALQSMANAIHDREQRLNSQLLFLQQLMDSIPVPVYYKDTGGLYLGCNTAFEVLMGRPKNEIIGKTVNDVAQKERAARHFETDLALLAQSGIQTYEADGVYGDGKFHNIVFNKAAFFDADNRMAGIVGALIDITDRRKAEEELRESEEKFRVLAETSPTAFIVIQGEYVVYANPSTVHLLGYSEAELLSMKFWECVHPEYRTMAMERGLARQRGEPVTNQYEIRLVKKSGEEVWVIISAGRIIFRREPGGIATLVDISEAKRAEENMKAALAEKEVLLKEVHHRVKNNMQIISSLLDLQSDVSGDELTRSCLRESQNRIRSMALIHEQLYQTKNFSSIDIGEYIKGLANYLFTSYTANAERISLNIDAEKIFLEIHRAVPCGLIINELLSNTLKHAFPDGRSGSVSVRVNRDAGWILLEVADTGIGMPAGLDTGNTETLGLQLVDLLTRQLMGRVSFERGQNGLAVSVAFPEDRSQEVALTYKNDREN